MPAAGLIILYNILHCISVCI